MLDFRMETFLTVCRFMNFTRASEKLNITQPAVSQHIRFLEEHYHAKLFRYEGRKLKLTEAGEILRNASLTMMHDEQSMQNRMIAGKILKKYMDQYPDAKIRMIVENTRELLRRLDEGSIDFALVEGFFQKNEYECIRFSAEPYIAVCAADYPFRVHPEVIEDLFRERLLLREEGSGTREVLERCLNAQNLSVSDFERTAEAGSLQTIKELTKAGCGITFLYGTAVQDELKDGTLIQIPLRNFQVYHEFNFIWRRGSIYGDRYREIFRRFSGQAAAVQERG